MLYQSDHMCRIVHIIYRITFIAFGINPGFPCSIVCELRSFTKIILVIITWIFFCNITRKSGMRGNRGLSEVPASSYVKKAPRDTMATERGCILNKTFLLVLIMWNKFILGSIS